MRKEQYDVLLKAADFLTAARENVFNWAETAEVVIGEATANAVQILDSVLSKIDEALLADPVEDVVKKPKDWASDVPSWLSGVFDQAGSVWERATDSAVDEDPEEDEEDVSPPRRPGVSRDEKIARIAKVMREWRNEEFVKTKSDSEVDLTYAGVLFGEKLSKSLKGFRKS